MPRSVPLAVALAVLAFAAPAQAEITGSTITSPKDPNFVLNDFDKPEPVIDIAGTATGSGNIDIVCVRAGAVHVLLRDQPVAASGTFSLFAVTLTGLPGTQWPYGPGLPCRLLAVPAGMTSPNTAAFTGPRLAVSSIHRYRWAGAGASAGVLYEADVYPVGLQYAARAETFGSVGVFNGFIADPNSSEVRQLGLFQTGAPLDDPATDHFGLEIDGQAAYPPTRAISGIGGTNFSENEGIPAVEADVTSFSSTTGDLTFWEADPLVKCGPNNIYPPTAASCTRFTAVPVRVERTTEYSYDTRTVRVTDQWSSTDGKAHRLDLSLRQGRCFGEGCTTDVIHRLPGDADYGSPAFATPIGPIDAQQPIFSRHTTDDSLGGTAVIPGQRADFARFDTQYAFVLAYKARTVPASGELTLTHTYVTTGSASDLEETVINVIAAMPAPPSGSTPPRGSTPTTPSHPVVPPAAPKLTRHGHVRVLRGFLVRTRDWVQCPAGGAVCVVSVRGTRVRSSQKTVAAGATARVAVKLNRRGIRALTRRGRVRLAITVSARAGDGKPVTRVRRLTVRQHESEVAN